MITIYPCLMNKCPRCDGAADLSKDNSFRPFCSQKCKLIDLGEWANEEHVISRPIELDDLD
jgi:endogenous inhibitor of DNA gyrase (YacG/DUF329 family)